MDFFIALYRGINVTGKHIVKMEALRAMHERLGHRRVQSYIQSGNVVFQAKGTAQSIARKVAAEFAKEFGFASRVIVIDSTRLRAILLANPFAKHGADNPKTVHVGVCQGKPDGKSLNTLLAKTGGTETFSVEKEIVYLHAPNGYGTSKFASGMEKACGVPMTVRNWRTMQAIGAILGLSDSKKSG